MGHTSGALRSRNFAFSARGLRPDGKTPRWWVERKRLGKATGKDNRTSQAVLGGSDDSVSDGQRTGRVPTARLTARPASDAPDP